MRIEKRGSSYRVRKMIDGKSVCVSFDHSPSEKEVIKAMSAILEKREAEEQARMIFEEAAKSYIETKRNVLSPATIRSYSNMLDNLSATFTQINIYKITQVDINREVNLLAADKAPKTVRNYHGFISAVLGTFRPELRISTTLPQKRKSEAYRPTVDDIKRILEDIEKNDTVYFLPLCLSCYGLRRGEVCSLELSDIKDNTIHVCKSKVLDDQKNWIVKYTKTTASDRVLPVSPWLIQAIKDQGYIFNGHPNQLLKSLQRSQDRLGIPKFPLHKLRSFFCAVVSETTDEQTVLDLGGWQTPHVMKEAYRYSLVSKEDELKRAAIDPITKIVDSVQILYKK